MSTLKCARAPGSVPALKHFLPALEEKHILVQTDNKLTVYHVNNQGGVRSRQSLQEAQRFLCWAFPRLASLRAMHLPGVDNQAFREEALRGVEAESLSDSSVVGEIWEGRNRPFRLECFNALSAGARCAGSPLTVGLSAVRVSSAPAARANAAQDCYGRTHSPAGGTILAREDLVPHDPTASQRGTIASALEAVLLYQVGSRIWHPHPDSLRPHLWPLKGRTSC